MKKYYQMTSADGEKGEWLYLASDVDKEIERWKDIAQDYQNVSQKAKQEIERLKDRLKIFKKDEESLCLQLKEKDAEIEELKKTDGSWAHGDDCYQNYQRAESAEQKIEALTLDMSYAQEQQEEAENKLKIAVDALKRILSIDTPIHEEWLDAARRITNEALAEIEGESIYKETPLRHLPESDTPDKSLVEEDGGKYTGPDVGDFERECGERFERLEKNMDDVQAAIIALKAGNSS